MATSSLQPYARSAWALARRQHGVVARAQLLEIGFTPSAIRHRLRVGRLHVLHRGVYAIGRPEIDQLGRWMAAVLSCGPRRSSVIAVLPSCGVWAPFPSARSRSWFRPGSRADRPGVRVHRRAGLDPSHRRVRERIPITDIVTTLIDLAMDLDEEEVEAAINAADRRGLIDPGRLRSAVAERPPRPGSARLGGILDRHGFAPTESYLERHFLSLIRRGGLPTPETQAKVNGFRVDFYWPELGLVVETDGLKYHRTAIQQARDLRRDQAHSAAGLETLRFSAAQVRDTPDEVLLTLVAVVARLSATGA